MSVEVWPFTHVVQRNVNFDESQSFTYLYYNVIVYKMKYDLKGHGRSNKALVAKFFYSRVIYQLVLIKILMNANIIKTQFKRE